MSHYLVIRVEDKETADTLAETIRLSFIAFRNYEIGLPEDVYYNASNVCEDITRVSVLIKKEDEDGE